MRSVRKVAFPVPFFSRRASAASPHTPMAAMAVQTAAKGSDGHGAAEGADQGGEHTTAAGDAGHGGAAIPEDHSLFPVRDDIQRAGQGDDAANAPGQPRDRLDSGR